MCALSLPEVRLCGPYTGSLMASLFLFGDLTFIGSVVSLLTTKIVNASIAKEFVSSEKYSSTEIDLR